MRKNPENDNPSTLKLATRLVSPSSLHLRDLTVLDIVNVASDLSLACHPREESAEVSSETTTLRGSTLDGSVRFWTHSPRGCKARLGRRRCHLEQTAQRWRREGMRCGRCGHADGSNREGKRIRSDSRRVDKCSRVRGERGAHEVFVDLVSQFEVGEGEHSTVGLRWRREEERKSARAATRHLSLLRLFFSSSSGPILT